MIKERTKQIFNWEGLIDFVNSVNQNEKAVVLSGWNLDIIGKDKTRIKHLYFTTKPVDVLLDKKAVDDRYIEKSVVKKVLDGVYYKIPNGIRANYESFFYKISYLLGLNGFVK